MGYVPFQFYSNCYPNNSVKNKVLFKVIISFISSPAVYKSSYYFTFLETFGILWFEHFWQFHGYEMVNQCIFSTHFYISTFILLMYKDLYIWGIYVNRLILVCSLYFPLYCILANGNSNFNIATFITIFPFGLWLFFVCVDIVSSSVTKRYSPISFYKTFIVLLFTHN